MIAENAADGEGGGEALSGPGDRNEHEVGRSKHPTSIHRRRNSRIYAGPRARLIAALSSA